MTGPSLSLPSATRLRRKLTEQFDRDSGAGDDKLALRHFGMRFDTTAHVTSVLTPETGAAATKIRAKLEFMEVHLTAESEAFIAQSVSSGRFSSADEAVRVAVEMLETRERGVPEMRAFVQEGLADLKSAQYEDFTDENLRELFDGVARRGRERLLAGSRK